MRRVFVDTSAFVAARNKRDPDNERARGALGDLVSRGVRLFTSNFVFAETHAALLVRTGRDQALQWGSALRASDAIELVRIEPEIEEEAWRILESHADKSWSYVDASSFALMEQEGVTEAFSFDRDFAQRGLKVVPG
ncbi:MAG: PIN domain-containing protein [Actinomycetota bacterium]